MKGDWMIPSPD